MAVETAELGKLAAEFMAEVEEKFGDNASLGVFAIILEVDVPAESDDDPGWTEILYRCSDQRRWLQSGLFAAAGRAVLESTTPDDDED